MMKQILNLAFLFILAKASYAQKEEQVLVKKAFDSYKSSILNDKGEEAVKYVDSRTFKYYDQVLDLVKHADSTEVANLSLLDKLMVLSIRHRTSREDILSFDGKGLLIYAIESGMVGKNSVANNSIGKTVVDDNFAKGQLIVNGKEAPLHFHFYKEEGEWKIDLTSIFSITNLGLKKMVEDSAQSDNDFILNILETLPGEKPGSAIWEKIE
jgi:hypothetical protein